jgi:hypothetical protein
MWSLYDSFKYIKELPSWLTIPNRCNLVLIYTYPFLYSIRSVSLYRKSIIFGKNIHNNRVLDPYRKGVHGDTFYGPQIKLPLVTPRLLQSLLESAHWSLGLLNSAFPPLYNSSAKFSMWFYILPTRNKYCHELTNIVIYQPPNFICVSLLVNRRLVL